MFKNQKEIRVGIYILGVVAQITSFFVTVVSPEWAEAFTQTADVLTVVALGTALTNITDTQD